MVMGVTASLLGLGFGRYFLTAYQIIFGTLDRGAAMALELALSVDTGTAIRLG